LKRVRASPDLSRLGDAFFFGQAAGRPTRGCQKRKAALRDAKPLLRRAIKALILRRSLPKPVGDLSRDDLSTLRAGLPSKLFWLLFANLPNEPDRTRGGPCAG
jgi:hypothetical protein